MPVTTQNYFNLKRLNRIFALSAILMLASLLWAIWHDFDRPWRRIQQGEQAWSVALIDQQIDRLRREGNSAQADVLTKRRAELVPQGFWANTADKIRSLPLLQFINPRERIRQVVLSDVQTDLSFTRVDTTDRCTTCHINIDRKEFSRAALIDLLETELAREWGVNLPAVPLPKPDDPRIKLDRPIYSKARLAALKIPDAFAAQLLGATDPESASLLDEQYRYTLVEQVNAIRQARGEKPLDPSPVYLAHPRLDLYASETSPHPVEKLGCTSCHDGSGNETDFVLAAHQPRPMWVDSVTGEPVIELADSSSSPSIAYTNEITGKTGTAIPQITFWKNRFERESGSSFDDVSRNWDTPMRLPEYMQASCARCHSNISDIAKEAPILQQGRALFARLGCVNCHQMDSIPPADPKNPRSGDRARVGSDLRNINAKLSPAMINSWLWAPRSFSPSALMPHFFMLENNSSPEELRRTRTEARAITQYLLASATRHPQVDAQGKPIVENGKPVTGPLPPAQRLDPNIKPDPIKGQQLFEKIGCTACHTNLADPVDWDDPDTKKEPTKRRAELWIVTDLVQRQGMTEDQAKSAYSAMDYRQKQRYCLDHFGSLTSSGPQQTYPDGTPVPRFMYYGPELSGIADKLLTGRSRGQASAWLFDWLRNPRHYSGTTAMPSLRLSDSEAANLVEYLLGQRRKNLDPKDSWKAELFDIDSAKLTELVAWFLRVQVGPERADTLAVQEKTADGQPGEITTRAAEALTSPSILTATEAQSAVQSMNLQEKQLVFVGKKLVANYGCFNCHAINGTESMSSPCPNLSDWGQKPVARLDFGLPGTAEARSEKKNASDVILRGVLRPEGSGNAVEDHSSGDKPFLNPEPRTLNPSQSAIGNRQSAIPQHSALSTQHSPAPTRESWLRLKLANPRIFDRGRTWLDSKPYDKLKMPQFFLNDRQIRALITFVTSNRPRLISDRMLASVNDTHHTRLALGRQAAERFNCTSCHAMQDNDPAIAQYFEAEREDMSRYWLLAPPDLRGEGSRVQPSWLFGFLKNVEPIRPQVQSRMPSFYLDDSEAERLTAYFAALAQDQSRWLAKRLEPIERYVASKEKSTTRPADPNQSWPGDDWYKQSFLADQNRALERWALSRRLPQITAANLDPRKTTGIEADKIHRTLLFEARFLAGLWDAPYPLVESPRPQVSPEMFNRGEAFFRELACIQCHTLGDPTTLATLKRPEPPKGPNLASAHRRLQGRWADHWVQQTNLILPVGSPMPPFFDGLPAWHLQGLPAGQDAATLSAVPPEKRKKAEELMIRYGATAAQQKELLLNFVFAAGARNYTIIPTAAVPATRATSGKSPSPAMPDR